MPKKEKSILDAYDKPPTPQRPAEARERMFEILSTSKYTEPMQSRLGR